jgi:AcrR family transcriptional regulator
MAISKQHSTLGSGKGVPTRLRVLDAAERLLRDGKAAFSMRDLAAEASVSFATPFNQFGSKAEIMYALSGRRIDAMEEQYAKCEHSGDALRRVRVAVDIAATVMLKDPGVNRAVMEWLGTAHPGAGLVLQRSRALWAKALGDGDGLLRTVRNRALEVLPTQLAFAFRGVLSFWTAGEISNDDLTKEAVAMAESIMLGYIAGKRG